MKTPEEIRREVATQIFAAMLSQTGCLVSIDGPMLGSKQAATAVSLADTLIAELEKVK